MIVKLLATAGMILVIVALITRFGTGPKNNPDLAPNTIKAGFGAMTNIFKGVFRG